MSEAKHTPGKWMPGWETTSGLTGPRCAPSVYLRHVNVPVKIPIHDGSRPIAWVLSSLPDDRANSDARLIAASPELLEALIDVLTWMDAPDESAFGDSQLAKVRAAIAKATGEQK